MLDLGIGLGLILAGFAFGYGAREVISYRRRQATIRRYHELGWIIKRLVGGPQ